MSKNSNPPNVTRSIKNCKGLTRIPKSEEEQIMDWLQNNTSKNLNQSLRKIFTDNLYYKLYKSFFLIR